MARPTWASDEIDIEAPSVARVYDYLLGGHHNFAADRELARQAVAAMPGLPANARINRAFLRRAVRYLLDAGVRQFLDIGSGIPTVGNVHEIAQRVDPQARVAYVDIDPVAVSHSQALLADNDRAVAIREDVRRPQAILSHPDVRALLDFDQPIAVLMVALLHYVPEEDDPYAVVARIRGALTPGSYLVISHGLSEPLPEESSQEVVRLSRRTTTGLVDRTWTQIERFLAGWEPVEPGLVWAPLWHPESGEDVDEHPELSGSLAAVARKP